MKSIITNLKFIILSVAIILGFSESVDAAEVDGIYRGTPTQQNTLAGSLKWNVFFDDLIQSSTLSISDFNLNTLNGDAIGVVTNIVEIYPSFFEVHAEVFSGTGDVRLDFTGQVTDFSNNTSKNNFTKGDIYTILANVTVKSIVRNTPTNQNIKENFVTWTITFDRAINSSTVSASDFSLSALSGQLSGNIISAFGFDDTYYVSVANINKDATLRLDFIGFVTDNDGISGFTPFFNGETYLIDFTNPVLNYVHISTNNDDDETLAYPKETVTVEFVANENISIINSNINGLPGLNSNSSPQAGKARYTFNYTDTEGPILFSIVVEDLAGNRTTFNSTTDGSFANFKIPPPYVILIDQPNDVIECEGSSDQFLFVIAAPSDRKLNIAYRWWKDGRPITDWQADVGQLNFDSLEFSMSGKYKAEMFLFDEDYNKGPFRFEAAKVSEVVFSDETNLYVLQKPSFLKDIPDIITTEKSDIVITFDANIYGEHNMVNPSYWTDIQWFKDSVELKDDFRIQGTDASILSINDINSTDYSDKYQVRLMSDCDTIWSNDFAISEEPQTKITLEPINVEGCVDEVVQFNLEAEATTMNTSLAYQWMVNGMPIIDEVGKFSGTNTDKLFITLNPDLGYDGTEKITCNVWPVGYPNNGVISAVAMITWKTAPVLVSGSGTPITATVGDTVVMYVKSTGKNITYKWSKNLGTVVIPNSNNDTLIIENVTLADASTYSVTISNDCGEIGKIFSLEVTKGPIITGVEHEFSDGVINIYPNPLTSNSILNINADKSGEASVILTDLLGNRLAEFYDGQFIKNESKSINLNVEQLNLSSGSYYILIDIDGNIESRQVSVVR